MRVRTESGTVYSVVESRDATGPLFTVTRESEAAPNVNGIRLGYTIRTRCFSLRVGDRLRVPADLEFDHAGIITTPVLEVLP